MRHLVPVLPLILLAVLLLSAVPSLGNGSHTIGATPHANQSPGILAGRSAPPAPPTLHDKPTSAGSATAHSVETNSETHGESYLPSRSNVDESHADQSSGNAVLPRTSSSASSNASSQAKIEPTTQRTANPSTHASRDSLQATPQSASASDTWAQICATCSPPARVRPSLAYDPSNGYVVLFGGYNGGSYNAGYLADTWEFKGGTWQQVTVSNAPLPRYETGFDYDPNLGEFLLFGGYGCTSSACSSLSAQSDTWTFNDNSNTWTQLSPSNHPVSRFNVGMTYDTALGETILYGGTDGSSTFGDTWSYKSGAWNPISTSGSIPARSDMGMVYDSGDAYLLVFGGCCSSTGPYADTWYLSGSTWTQVTPFGSPAARDALAMSYDSVGKFALLFGGLNSWNSPSTIYGDTWAYSAGSWTQLSPGTSPPSRYESEMVYDSGDGYTVLFAGQNSNYQYVQDAWAFPPSFTASLAASPANIDEGQTTTLSASPSGGYSPYTYSWQTIPQGCTGSNSASLSCTPTTYGQWTLWVKVTDAAGHVANANANLDVNQDPQASFTASKSNLDVGQSTTLTGSASQGSGGYSYAWSGLPPGCSSTSSSFTCTPTGTGGGSNAAKLTVTDSDGGTGTYIVTILVSTDPSVTKPSASPGSLDANQVTTLSSTASGGSGGDSFSWSGLPTGCSTSNAASISCTPNAAGNYSITVSVTDSNGWTTTSQALSLTAYRDPTVATPTASRWSADTGQSVSFSTGAYRGYGGYSYSWSGMPTGCSGSNSATISCSPTSVGLFSITAKVTDGNGYAVASSVLSFTVYGTPSVDYLLGPGTPDANQQVTVQIDRYQSGSGGDKFVWSGFPSGCSSVNLTYLTCSPAVAGWFNITVTVTDSNGGSGSEIPFTLHVLSDPSIGTPTATPYAVDVGQSDTFSANPSGGSRGYSYSWTALPQGCLSSNTATLTCSPTTPGTYPVQVAVTDSNNYQVQSSTLSFVVHSNPMVSLAGNRTVLDIGESIFFWANASGGSSVYSYWYQGLPCPTANLSRLTCTPSARGTYTVTVTVNDTLGNSGTSGPFPFTVDSDPSLNTWLSRGGFIDYANASLILQLNYSGGTPNYRPCLNAPGSILGGMACGVWQGGSKYAFGLWYTTAGSFAVTASLLDSTGWNVTTGVTFTIYYSITVGTPAVPPIDTGQGLTLSAWEAHGAPPLTSWWNDSTSGTPLCGPTSSSPGAALSCTFTASWTGQHTLNITVRDGLGSPYYLTFAVSPNPRPSLSVQALPSIILTNSTLSPQVSVSGGSANFRYCLQAQAGGPWTCSPAPGTSATSYTFTVSYLAPGTYTMTLSVLDAASVNATTTRSLTVYYPLALGSLSVGPSPSDEGLTTSVNATIANGVAGFVGWLNDTTAGTSLCGPLALAADGTLSCVFSPTWTGTHGLLLTVRDAFGESRSSARTLTANPPLAVGVFNGTAGNRSVGIGGVLSTEAGAPVFLNATFGQGTSGYSCVWSSGSTVISQGSGSTTSLDAIYEWTTVGTYTVTFRVTDAAGDTVVEQFVLQVAPTMTGLSLSASLSPVDAGVSDNLTLSFQNGVAPFSFLWEFGDNHTAQTLTAWIDHAWPVPGTYAINVTIRDAERANVSTTLELVVGPALTVPCAPVSHGTLQTNDALNFTVSCVAGGFTPYHYRWTFGDGSVLASPVPWASHAFSSAGQYQVSVLVTDAGGGNETSVALAIQVQNPSPGPGPGGKNPPGGGAISAAEWFLIAIVGAVAALVAITSLIALRRRSRRLRGTSSASATSSSGSDSDATKHLRMSLTSRPGQTGADLIPAVAKESGLDEQTIATQLQLLVSEGTVRRTGDGVEATYSLSSEPDSAQASVPVENTERSLRISQLQERVRAALPESGTITREDLLAALADMDPEWPEVASAIHADQTEGLLRMEKSGGTYVLRRTRPAEKVEPAPPRAYFAGNGERVDQGASGLTPSARPSWPSEPGPEA